MDVDDAFAGVLVRAPPASTSAPDAVDRREHRHRYYQDRNKRWAFACDDRGATLLERLFARGRSAIDVVDAAIASACEREGTVAEEVKRTGAATYSKKPSMKSADVTWSQEEYRHLGLQREYVRFKSVQRFTETWACLERGMYGGFLRRAERGGTIRCASLGGGPGFELVAFQEFFKAHYPTVELDLISLDLEESWRASSEALGLRFARWDMRDGGVADACGVPKIDFAIASYVFKMYMCEDVVADWLATELTGIEALFVINRDENLRDGCALMERRGVDVTKLLPQANGRDDRQLVFSRGQDFPRPSGGMENAEPSGGFTFPNVPYMEHKSSSNHQRGGGWRGHGSHHDHDRRSRPDDRRRDRW